MWQHLSDYLAQHLAQHRMYAGHILMKQWLLEVCWSGVAGKLEIYSNWHNSSWPQLQDFAKDKTFYSHSSMSVWCPKDRFGVEYQFNSWGYRKPDRGRDMKSVQRGDHPKSNSPVHFIDGTPPLAHLTVIASAARSCWNRTELPEDYSSVLHLFGIDTVSFIPL